MNITDRDIKEFEKMAGIMDWFSRRSSSASNAAGAISRRVNDSPLLRGALDAVGLLGLVGMGATALSSGYNAIKDKVKSHNSYKQMFEEFPELQDAPRRQVDKYWGILEDYAPKLTTNPLVAGQFVSNMMQYGLRGVDHNTVGQLASISKDLDSVANPRSMQDFSSKVTIEAMRSPSIMDPSSQGLI